MANPFKYIGDVYNAKVGYGNATTDEERKAYQDKANAARKWLSDNDYKDVAAAISAEGATADDVKKYMTAYGKTGKTPTRDYYYSLGKKYGLSSNDVDKIISWDDDSGQVYLGGKLVGTPDAVVDGVSYWGDTSVLDKSFEDYASRTGLTRTAENQVSQENESLFAKYNQEYEDLKKTNPFTTEEAKAILAKYDLAGLQGRDNAVASNAGSNGGNIDSFAAANAMRQQAALVNQGQMAVLEAHQQKLDHARALLSDMGVNIDRVFNQDETVKNREFEQSETAKNNKVARDSEIARVSGYNNLEWTIANDPVYSTYLNPDGTLKEKYKNNTDFQALYEKAIADGDTELADKYAAIRTAKANTFYDEYRWALNSGANGYIKPQRTSEHELTNKQIDVSKEVSLSEIDAEKYKADTDAKAGITVQQLKNEGNSTGTPKLTTADKQAAKSQMDSTLSKWLYTTFGVDYLFDDSNKTLFKPDWNENTNEVYAARDKLNDAEALAFLRDSMIGAGWTAKEWESKLYEWKTNIAKKAAQIEGKDKADPYAWIDTMYKWKWIGASEKAELDKKYGR